MIGGAILVAIAEGYAFAAKAGIDLQTTFEATRCGFAGGPMYENKVPKLIKRDYEPGARVAVHRKDIVNAKHYAHKMGVDTPLTDVVLHVMDWMQDNGHIDEDQIAMVKYYEDKMGSHGWKRGSVSFNLQEEPENRLLFSGRHCRPVSVGSAALLGRGAADEKSHAAGDKIPELGDCGGQSTGFFRRGPGQSCVPQEDQHHETEKAHTGGHQDLDPIARGRSCGRAVCACLDTPGFQLGQLRDKSNLIFGLGRAAGRGFRQHRRIFLQRGGDRRFLLVPGGKVGAEKIAENGRCGGADHNVDAAGELTVSCGEKQGICGLGQENGHQDQEAPGPPGAAAARLPGQAAGGGS